MCTVFCLVLSAVVSLRAVPLLVAAQPKTVSPAAPPAALAEDRLVPTLEFLPESPPEFAAFARPAAAPPARQTPDIQVYQGKKFRFVKTLSVRVTAYAPDPRCCYPYDGTTTASGLPVTTNGGHLVAADTSVIPMHSLVIVPGYARGAAVPVLDRGAAIKGRRLDVLLPGFAQAQAWGVRNLEIKVFAPVK
jgi:3D (Asp-Asp-Asp) domain-containing protein